MNYSKLISILRKKNKVNIIGPPGSGKTTLCEKVSKELKLDLIELDEILFDKNCNAMKNKNMIFLNQLISSPKCIVDGTYYSLVSQKRIEETDLFVMLKINFFKTFFRIIRRSIYKSDCKCAERFSFSLIKFLMTYYLYKKRLMIKLIPKNKLLIIKIN
tara:strand:+ start:1615 stop:2091 length:477 start_codon:yes stop_codon:yes gene_type:complete